MPGQTRGQGSVPGVRHAGVRNTRTGWPSSPGRDGHAHFFDGAKDLFKFLLDPARYAPGHRKEDLAGIYVTDFYNLERIDARKAYFVVGSDVLGPMGHELVPLASKADAEIS